MSETYRIVIADDEAIICMDLKEILEERVLNIKYVRLNSLRMSRSICLQLFLSVILKAMW